MITVTVIGLADIGTLIGGREQQILLPYGAKLRNLLGIMIEKYGSSFAQRVFKEDDTEPRNELILLVNGKDIHYLHGLETELKEGDRILIGPPLAGG